jgi:hypothetical protein
MPDVKIADLLIDLEVKRKLEELFPETHFLTLDELLGKLLKDIVDLKQAKEASDNRLKELTATLHNIGREPKL